MPYFVRVRVWFEFQTPDEDKNTKTRRHDRSIELFRMSCVRSNRTSRLGYLMIIICIMVDSLLKQKNGKPSLQFCSSSSIAVWHTGVYSQQHCDPSTPWRQQRHGSGGSFYPYGVLRRLLLPPPASAEPNATVKVSPRGTKSGQGWPKTNWIRTCKQHHYQQQHHDKNKNRIENDDNDNESCFGTDGTTRKGLGNPTTTNNKAQLPRSPPIHFGPIFGTWIFVGRERRKNDCCTTIGWPTPCRLNSIPTGIALPNTHTTKKR